jgi:mannose-6-phosphate isomerase-like protein (cupin superfamily)
MISIQEFDSFIQNDIVFDQRILFYIDSGKDYLIQNLGQLHSNFGKTLKLECGERLNRTLFNYCKSFSYDGPVTCHVYRSFKNSHSYNLHTDPYDVLLKMIEGEKLFEIEGKKILLKKEKDIFIPANTLHKATNITESLMLSIGFEKFLVDKIL